MTGFQYICTTVIIWLSSLLSVLYSCKESNLIQLAFFFLCKQPQLGEKHCGLGDIELIAIFTLSIFRAGQHLVKVMRILITRISKTEGKGKIFFYSTSAFVQHSCQGSSSYGVQVIFCTSCFFNDDSKCTVKQSWGKKKLKKPSMV